MCLTAFAWPACASAERTRMFFWFLVAVAIVIGLTLLGAFIARRDPGTNWEGREDRPIGPWMEH